MVWETSTAGMVMTPSWERTRSPANLLLVLHHLYKEDFPYEKMAGSPSL